MKTSTRGTSRTSDLDIGSSGGIIICRSSSCSDYRLSASPAEGEVKTPLTFDATRDAVSFITQKPVDATMGRLGLRLQGQWTIGSAQFMPYLRIGVRHDFRATDLLVFDGVDAIPTRRGGTSMEVGGGFVWRVNKTVSAFATADYRSGGGGTYRRSYAGTIGLRVSW